MSLSDTRVIPAMIYQIKTGKPLTIHGNGKQSRTFCYADDLVNGFLTIMKKGKGKFFVSNQGGLSKEPEAESNFNTIPKRKKMARRPLWDDVGNTEICHSDCNSEKMDLGTLEEMKGGERLW